MRGYVGLVDSEWYHFLAARPEISEVNFWSPHALGRKFFVLDVGEFYLL